MGGIVTFSVVVTGASGFIGSALIQRLKCESDIDVIPVSRSSIDKSNVYVDDYCETPVGTVLVHLAEESDRLRVNKAGDSYLNKSGMTLDSLIAKGYKNIIYCSSAVVYGDAGNVPYTEELQVYPYDNYTLMKLSNEQKVINAGGIVARLANVIGPGMANNNVLSDILSQLSNPKVLCVHNDKPIRDFICVDDVVIALMRMIIGGGSGIYNIGTGVGISIREMANMALKSTGESVREVKSHTESSTYSYNVIDIGKMVNTYKWVPKITLKESIEKLIRKT
jgi:UDP-glucose 4-epimerase